VKCFDEGMDVSKHEGLFNKRKKEYKNYKPVWCEALHENIEFNSDGFNHLRFNSKRKPRELVEQIYKLSLLPLVIPVIKTTHIIESNRVKILSNGKRIEYWSLVGKVGKNKSIVRVVLRRTGVSGKLHFWSVMKLHKYKTPLP
jgi:hypothetical protein